MKFGVRKPNLKSSFKARTTGRAKRAVKRALIPGYGRKGAGWVKNPKKAAYNYVYHRTTVGVGDIARWTAGGGKSAPVTTPQSQATKTDSLARRLRLVEKVSTPRQVRTAFWLCVLLGWLGAHRYYLRKWGSALVYTFTAGIFFFGWIRDVWVLARLRTLISGEDGAAGSEDEPGNIPDVEFAADRDKDLTRLADHALDAAEGLGIDVASARDMLRSPFAEASGDGDVRRLCAGGGDEDEPLCVAKLGEESINIRYWSRRGAPDFEIDMDLASGTVAYAMAQGKRIV